MNRNFLITLLFLLSTNNILIGADKIGADDELTSIEELKSKTRKRLSLEEQRILANRLATPSSPSRRPKSASPNVSPSRRIKSTSPNVSPSRELPGSPQNKILLSRQSLFGSPPRSQSTSPNVPGSPTVFDRLYTPSPPKGKRGKNRRAASPLISSTPPNSTSVSPADSPLLKDLQATLASFDTTDTTLRLPTIAEVKHADVAIPDQAIVLALLKASQESEKRRLQTNKAPSDFHKPSGAFRRTKLLTDQSFPSIIEEETEAEVVPAVSPSFGLTPQPPAKQRAFANRLQPRRRASRPVATIPVTTIIEEEEENTPAPTPVQSMFAPAPVQSMFGVPTSRADTGIVVSVSGSGPTNYSNIRQQQLDEQDAERQTRAAVNTHRKTTLARLKKEAESPVVPKLKERSDKSVQFKDKNEIKYFDKRFATNDKFQDEPKNWLDIEKY